MSWKRFISYQTSLTLIVVKRKSERTSISRRKEPIVVRSDSEAIVGLEMNPEVSNPEWWKSQSVVAFYKVVQKGKKSTPSRTARELAVELANQITAFQYLEKVFTDGCPEFPYSKSGMYPLSKLFQGRTVFAPSGSWRRKVELLDELREDTVSAWVDAAWDFLVAVSPDEQPELNTTLCRGTHRICNVRRQRRDPYYEDPATGKPITRTSPGIGRADLKEALKVAFKDVAVGGSSRFRDRTASPTFVVENR